jgi:predicted Zn-dependent protease
MISRLKKIIDSFTLKSSIDRMRRQYDISNEYKYNFELINNYISEYIISDMEYDLDGLVLVALDESLYAIDNNFNFFNSIISQKISIMNVKINEYDKMKFNF